MHGKTHNVLYGTMLSRTVREIPLRRSPRDACSGSRTSSILGLHWCEVSLIVPLRRGQCNAFLSGSRSLDFFTHIPSKRLDLVREFRGYNLWRSRLRNSPSLVQCHPGTYMDVDHSHRILLEATDCQQRQREECGPTGPRHRMFHGLVGLVYIT